MNNDNSKSKEFEDLYTEYKKLKTSTHIEAQIGSSGQPYKVHRIIPDELKRRKDLAKELVKNYKEYFKEKQGEWFELEQDTI
jgi:hypothetical protein